MRKLRWLSISFLSLAIVMLLQTDASARKKRRKRKKKATTEQVALAPSDSVRMIHKPGVQNQTAFDSLKSSKNAEKKKNLSR